MNNDRTPRGAEKLLRESPSRYTSTRTRGVLTLAPTQKLLGDASPCVFPVHREQRQAILSKLVYPKQPKCQPPVSVTSSALIVKWSEAHLRLPHTCTNICTCSHPGEHATCTHHIQHYHHMHTTTICTHAIHTCTPYRHTYSL